jgi:hypothetical protein
MLLLVLLLVIVVFGILAIDIGHNITVRTELQNAVDAGALAGARDYVDADHYGLAYNDALSTTMKNSADGMTVGYPSSGSEIKVLSTGPANGSLPGLCQVNGKMEIPSVLGSFFGQDRSVVSVSARAHGYGSVTAVPANFLFPLAVSADTVSGHEQPLYKCHIGDHVTFYLNSRKYTNAAFTGLNAPGDASSVNDAMEKVLSQNKVSTDNYVEIGKKISLLNNNLHRVSDLSRGAIAGELVSRGNFILPLITGDGPYIQSRPVDGFVGVHIDGVRTESDGAIAINATIVKSVVHGKPGTVGSPTGIFAVDQGIQNISPGAVLLSPNTDLTKIAYVPETITDNYTAAPSASGATTTSPGSPLQTTTTGTGAISANFNSTTVNGALWVNAVGSIANNPNPNGTSILRFNSQKVTLTNNGTTLTYALPSSVVTISNKVSTPTTTYNSQTNTWMVNVPASYTGNFFIGGMPIQGTFSGGLQNVVYNGSFSTDTAGLTVNWQWAAAGYSNLSNNLNALGVSTLNGVAGVPSNFTQMLTGGGTSTGGTNYTGSYSISNTEVPSVQTVTASSTTPSSTYPTSGQGGAYNGNTYPTSGSPGSYNGNTYPTSGSAGKYNGNTNPTSGSAGAYNGNTYPTSGSSGAYNGNTYPTSGNAGAYNGNTYPTSGNAGAYNGNTYPTSGNAGAYNGNTYPTSGNAGAYNGNTYPTSGNAGAYNGNTYPTSGSPGKYSGQSYPTSGSVGAYNGNTYPTSGSTATSGNQSGTSNQALSNANSNSYNNNNSYYNNNSYHNNNSYTSNNGYYNNNSYYNNSGYHNNNSYFNNNSYVNNSNTTNSSSANASSSQAVAAAAAYLSSQPRTSGATVLPYTSNNPYNQTY